MKPITLDDAYDLLMQCNAVMLEDKILEPVLMGIEYDDNNEFLYLFWEEEHKNGDLFVEVVFYEGDNQKAELNGSTLTLVNSEGQEEDLVLLKDWDAEK
jgi:hypothetical protein